MGCLLAKGKQLSWWWLIAIPSSHILWQCNTHTLPLWLLRFSLKKFLASMASQSPLLVTVTLYSLVLSGLNYSSYKGHNSSFSLAYHPQTDGQTERINLCLECTCIIYAVSNHKSERSGWAMYWHNTIWKSAIGFTPYDGRSPPLFSSMFKKRFGFNLWRIIYMIETKLRSC